MSDPSVSVWLDDVRPFYPPGAVLSGGYRLDIGEGRQVAAVEVSVLWHTEGKGDEDLGVHHFEEWRGSEADSIDPCAERRFSTRLPRSPLSYDGLNVKILWYIRVRVVIPGWQDRLIEVPFRLGDVLAAREVST
jgi:hypothetical protein